MATISILYYFTIYCVVHYSEDGTGVDGSILCMPKPQTTSTPMKPHASSYGKNMIYLKPYISIAN